jgi:hypothetical protein
MKKYKKAYKHIRILILSDSQSALKAFSSQKVTARLFAECLIFLSELAQPNEFTLCCVPGHRGVHGNEEYD